ncbi:PKD domain-containing protein [Blastococcus litoris]|uniref:PKD domain-containing protein n=1 Tax=Blastococcus litoris TaxID=2171622 RepID=UPI000E303A0B|nr:PKD domain-containing protein [Blastococcus litoris]
MTARRIDIPRRVLGLLLGLLLVAGFLGVAAPTPARADSAPLNPANPTTPTSVAADRLPTVQINGVVWQSVVVGDTVYVGGKFTRARPAGAAPGVNEVVRNNMLAFDINTGELITSFAPDLNGQVLGMAASPDGSRIYVGGDFTTANGQSRNRVAAYDTATGALVSTFRPSVSGQVRAIAATNSTVYLGGAFTAVGGVARKRLAAVTAASGALVEGWAPFPGEGSTAGNRNGATGTSTTVMDLVIAGGQVIAGGRFDSLNGIKSTGVGAIDASTGATLPFAINQLITNQGINSAIYSLATDGTLVFGTGYDYYGPGNLEGSFSAVAVGGAVVSINDCRGDTYGSYSTGGLLYLAGHPHFCQNIGGYPESPSMRATAVSIAPSGVVGTQTLRNSNFVGQPAAKLQTFYPVLDTGTFTGQSQAAWSVGGNDEYVVYGGEFPFVNGTRQQGLVRFAVPSIAPNDRGPASSGLVAPTASTLVPGTVRLTWTTTSDQDNEYLTYRVFRDGGATPVGETTVSSDWYRKPSAGFTDVGVPAGTHRYRVVATDPWGNVANYPEVSIDVAGGGATTRPYAQAVRSAGAQDHWPLTETTGVARDQVQNLDLTASSGVTRGQAGAITGDSDPSYRFSGSNAFLSTQTAIPAPTTFTVEAWFRTNSTAGGKIIGFGNARTGNSTTHDRSVYVDESGRLVFGVYDGARRTIQSPGTVEDGAWHHVAASLSSSGAALYLDGVLVGSLSGVTTAQPNTGYWRVGGDTSWSGANYFNGWIDEPAVYLSALSPLEVAGHHALGAGTTVPNVAPTAAFTYTATNLSVAFDGTSSTDPENGALTYAWNFGDGGTSTEAKPTHPYAAAGDYQVTLTVTDPQNASDPETKTVTVTAPPNQPPTSAFTFTPNALSVAFDGTSSTDPENGALTYAWDFGDGGTSTEAKPTHPYSAGGTYPVTLVVKDPAGNTGSSTQQVQVTDPGTPPQGIAVDSFGRTVGNGWGSADTGGAWTVLNGPGASSSVSAGAGRLQFGTAGHTSYFTLGGVSAGDVAVQGTFTLDTPPTGGGVFASLVARRVDAANMYRAIVKFVNDGRVTLTIARMAGGTETTLRGITVPGLTYTPGTPLLVRFDVSGASTMDLRAKVWAAGTPEPTAWQNTTTDSTAALRVPGAIGGTVYVSGSATALPVRFSVDDWWAGASGTAPGTTPPANQPPTAAFTHVATGLSVAFDGTSSTDPENGALTYAWDFGDGGTSTEAKPTHPYAAAGDYQVTLTVTDPQNASDPETKTVTVTAPPPPNQAPTAAFTYTATNLSVAFDGTSSTDPENGALTYAWSFGDGGTSTEATPTHPYAAAGDYQVTLTVTDPQSASDPETKTVSVSAGGPPPNQAPTAAFTYAATGLSVAFDGTSSTDPENGALTYAWNFGDGGTSTEATPTHPYAAAGDYQVTLTVTDPQNATDPETKQVTVTAAATPPIAADAFARTVTSGWGDADTGGPWTVSVPLGAASVSGGAGHLDVTRTGGTSSALLNGVSARDLALQAAVSLDRQPAGGANHVTVSTRRVSASTMYETILKFSPSGTVNLTLSRKVGNVNTTLQALTIPGLTYTSGTVLQLRLEVVGSGPTTLRAKLWVDGTAEPAAWQVSATDAASELQVAGAVGTTLYVSSAATTIPGRLNLDDWWIGQPGAVRPTP